MSTSVTTTSSFDVCGPLPSGLVVLEASAGTGKTFTIAALAARYVAEGTRLDRMLLVTFGRAATGELRARVRERLVSAEAGLALAQRGLAPDVDDEVLTMLADGPPEVVAVRRARLARALADFDVATITTTHGFCQQVLSGIGVAGDVDPEATFVEDLDDLVNEVVDDLYVRKYAHQQPPPELPLAVAREIGRAVVGQPAAHIVPSVADAGGDLVATRIRLAHAVRDDLERRKRTMRVLTYDDLLTRLAAALQDPATVARLRNRFDVVMVDEFQDTDPVQWDVLQRAFADKETTLVLIGDPKQAIYSFRGADVHTYLDAVGRASTVATLDTNWRSDQAIVDAYDELFSGMTLGHEGIEYRTVRAADANQRPRLRGAPHPAALRVRVVHRDDGRIDTTPQGHAETSTARRAVAADVAADIVELLAAKPTIVRRDRHGADVGEEPLGPGGIAVLVPTHREMTAVREALEAAGVPVVVAGARSVFGTPAAREWLALLAALERPSTITRVHAAALSPFIGWRVEDVATAGDRAWEDVHVRLHEWAAVLRTRGVAALAEAISHGERLAERLLAVDGGERHLTDIGHIAELLHREATRARLGVTALTSWLRARIREAGDDLDEERGRRLDTDAAAVQVITVHRCKGLQFPVVYCPYLWTAPYIPKDPLPVFADTAEANRRTIDVGGRNHPGYAGHHEQHVAEVRGESLRLAYVALTRSCHQTIVHWASSWDSRESALARILCASQLGPTDVALAKPPSEIAVVHHVEELAARTGGAIAVERSGGAGARWSGPQVAAPTLAVRRFARGFDELWRRASYSSLTAVAHEAFAAPGVASEPDVVETVDEPLDDDAVVVPSRPARAETDDDIWASAPALPLATMTGGTRTGTVVHAVLEHTDFAAADLAGALRAALAAETGWTDTAIGDPDDVVTGLALALDTPLGVLDDDARLRDIGRTDRLDELNFDLPLAGGDAPDGELRRDRPRRPARPRTWHADDVLAGYGDRLRDPLLTPAVRGYLTGSIDLVYRRVGPDGAPRFAIVDYKTNWLGADGGTLTARDYRPAALRAAMEHAHYPLQALFYLVALHRYLRWRLAGYDPATHLDGARYLFVRGMVGAQTPGGRRRPLRGVRLAAARRAGGGHQRSARSGSRRWLTSCCPQPGPTRTTPGWPSRPTGCCARSTSPACSTPPTSTWPGGSASCAVSPTRRCCSARRSPCAPRARRTSASTSTSCATRPRRSWTRRPTSATSRGRRSTTG